VPFIGLTDAVWTSSEQSCARPAFEDSLLLLNGETELVEGKVHEFDMYTSTSCCCATQPVLAVPPGGHNHAETE
jgi:hypothetical protein